MRTIVNTDNLTNPGVEPVDGDEILNEYSDGTSEQLVFNSADISLPEDNGDTFIITKAAFFDRMDIGDKLDSIYIMEQNGLKADPPDTTLHKTLDNVRQREFIDLQDPRMRPTLESLGLYTEADVDLIMAPAEDYEIPIALR